MAAGDGLELILRAQRREMEQENISSQRGWGKLLIYPGRGRKISLVCGCQVFGAEVDEIQ